MTLPATLQSLNLPSTEASSALRFHALAPLEAAGIGTISRLPVSLRIVLESLLRHCDGQKVTEAHVRSLANWQARGERSDEIPFVVSRVVLQDFTGVPLLVDLAAMRSAAQRVGADPARIEPRVPVDLVVDHSVQVDHFGTPSALQKNMEIEFLRNAERYQFLKWGMQAFETFKVVPPGVGIVHQVNLEYLFRGVHEKDGVLYPDTLVGTDSHTTMINGVGVVGWGVGGIEAEAAMLGQPVYLLTPDVIGVELTGRLREGVTATDLVLSVTEILRRKKVVGKFVEFFGEGAASLAVPDRATLSNMAPEYGATMGFFPVDEATVRYMQQTGRSEIECARFEAYWRAQDMFGMPSAGQIDYSDVVSIDLDSIVPSLAGPKRPQDRIALPDMKSNFETLFSAPVAENGFAKDPTELTRDYATEIPELSIQHGDILIAAITSCTNTSNPSVMIAAGLLAQAALDKGLRVKAHIKTSLAPGSRVVSDYLHKAGLLAPLAKLGFALAGYGCTTCIGNSGDLDPALNAAINEHGIIAAAVLSGNRNFEARIHPNIRANYLASPPLVVAFALAGRVNIDLSNEPLGEDQNGAPVFLRDIWPSSADIAAKLPLALDGALYAERYAAIGKDLELWDSIPAPSGQLYDWPQSTYIAEPPFFDGFSMQTEPIAAVQKARALLVLGDSVTTDHISPAGSFSEKSPAGQWLLAQGVSKAEFNSYGSRRGQHAVMIRGSFANVRIKNLLLPAQADGSRVEGGYTLLDGHQTSVFDAAQAWQARGTPSIVLAGEEYGTGSSRDWAAKGTQLLGVKMVLARSYERIHRANLVGMGVLPLQFKGQDSVHSLGLLGDETYELMGLDENIRPQQDLCLRITRADGSVQNISVLCRIDTPIEVDYYRHGGILPFVLRELLQNP